MKDGDRENSEVAAAIRGAGRTIGASLFLAALVIAAGLTPDREIRDILWGCVAVAGFLALLVLLFGKLASSAAGARDRKVIDRERRAQLSGRAARVVPEPQED